MAPVDLYKIDAPLEELIKMLGTYQEHGWQYLPAKPVVGIPLTALSPEQHTRTFAETVHTLNQHLVVGDRLQSEARQMMQFFNLLYNLGRAGHLYENSNGDAYCTGVFGDDLRLAVGLGTVRIDDAFSEPSADGLPPSAIRSVSRFIFS